MAAGRLRSSRFDKRYVRSDGGVVSALDSWSVIDGPPGSSLAFAAVIEDVTEQRQVEQALVRGQAFLEAGLDEVDVAVAACDAEGRVTVFNRVAKR